jgi:hypothetical protein
MDVSLRALMSVVKEIVRKEIARTLPSIVEKTLTETYLRKMIAENRARSSVPSWVQKSNETFQRKFKGSALKELLATDLESEEEIQPDPPEPIDAEGIYTDSNSRAARGSTSNDDKDMNESVKKLRAGVFGDMFEGVKPISESASTPGNIDAPIKGYDFNKMNEILQQTSPVSESHPNATLKLREIEARRKALDVPAVVVS